MSEATALPTEPQPLPTAQSPPRTYSWRTVNWRVVKVNPYSKYVSPDAAHDAAPNRSRCENYDHLLVVMTIWCSLSLSSSLSIDWPLFFCESGFTLGLHRDLSEFRGPDLYGWTFGKSSVSIRLLVFGGGVRKEPKNKCNWPRRTSKRKIQLKLCTKMWSRHSWLDPSAPTIMQPMFDLQVQDLCFFNWYLKRDEKRTKINEKEGGIGPLKKLH